MTLEAKDIEQHIEQIRDERREAANTAKRVGNTMMEIFKYVAAAVESALRDISDKYLSKEKNDIAKGLITFLQGIKIDDIFKFDKDGNIIAYTIASPEYSEKNKTGFAIAILDSDTGKYKLCIDEIAAWTKATVGQLIVEGNSIFNGDLSSPKFQSGFLDGFGWKIWGEAVQNAAGKLEQRYTGEIDNLIVRGTMRVFEMIISQLLGENDNRVFTGMLEVDYYDAESGKVYLDTKEGRMYNPFRKDDVIMVQQYNGMPSADNDYYVTKRYELIVTEVGSEGSGEDMLAWVKFRNFTSTMEGATPEKLIKKKDTFVRVDNLTDENRKGIVTITTVGPKTPYMDIIYGLKTDPDGALKGRLGNLQGITHPSFGQLKGFGELLQNLYAVGDLVLRRTGENIDTKFQVLSDLFSSNFTKTEYELTDDTNYLHNGQFMTSSADESIIDGWTIDDTDDTSFWVDPTTGMPVMVNGNASASGNRRVEIERTEGKQVLRLINCGITQKNALIDQPKTHKEYSNPSGKQNTKTDSAGNNAVTLNTATDGSVKDVQDTLYVSLRIYALTSGKLTVGFNGSTDVEGKDNTLKVRDITVPYSGEWTTVEFNGKWNGTGDFVIRYTGDCRVAFVAITDTALANLARTVSTSIEQTNEAIKLLGQNDDAIAGQYTTLGFTVDSLNRKIEAFVSAAQTKEEADKQVKALQDAIGGVKTTANNTATYVEQNKDSWNAAAGRFDAYGNLVEMGGLSISTYVNQMFNQKISYDNNGLISNISKTGLQTTTDFNNWLNGDYASDKNYFTNLLNGKANVESFASLMTTYADAAGVAKTASLSAYVTKDANNVIQSNVLINADQINLAANHQLSLKTGTFTIDSNNFTLDSKGNVAVDGEIKARSGNIAGFKISGTGLTNDPFQNDAYVIFRNDAHKCFAGIGGNVLPTSTGLRAVARFENEDKDDWFQSSYGYNIAMYLSAKNAKYNFAFCGSGHGVLNGNIMGYGYQDVVTVKNKISEIDLSRGNRVFTTYANNSGVALPTLSNVKLALGLGSSTTHFSLEITIIHLGGDEVAEHIYGKNNTVKDTADKHWMNNSEYPQLYNNDMGTIDSIRTGIGDIHTVMLFYDGINYKAFRVSYRD